MTRLEGGCGCGAVRYALRAVPYDCGFCHCVTCRRVSGAPLLAFGSVAIDAFEITQGELRRWRSSGFGERTCCAACGTQLTMQVDSQPDILDVALATLDDPMAVRPEFHIWTRSRLPWMVIGDGLAQYPTSRPNTAGA